LRKGTSYNRITSEKEENRIVSADINTIFKSLLFKIFDFKCREQPGEEKRDSQECRSKSPAIKNTKGLRVTSWEVRIKIPETVNINWAFRLFTPQPETLGKQHAADAAKFF